MHKLIKEPPSPLLSRQPIRIMRHLTQNIISTLESDLTVFFVGMLLGARCGTSLRPLGAKVKVAQVSEESLRG